MFTNLEHFSTNCSTKSLSLRSVSYQGPHKWPGRVHMHQQFRFCICHPVRFHLDAAAKFIFARGHHAAALYCLKGGTWLITPKGKANQNRQAPTIEYAKHQRCTYRMASFARLFGYIERCKTNCGFHNSTASNTWRKPDGAKIFNCTNYPAPVTRLQNRVLRLRGAEGTVLLCHII